MNIKTYFVLVKNSLQSNFAYRTTTIIVFFISLLFFLLEVITGFVYFNFTDSLGGLNKMQYFNLIITMNIILALFETFCLKGLEEIFSGINEGNLDYSLIRPVDSFFYYIFNGIELNSLASLILYTSLQIFLLSFQNISIIQFLLYIFFIILGAWYVTMLNYFIACLTFFFERANSLMNITEILDSTLSKPKRIFPKIVEYFFSFIIAYLLIYNTPIDILNNNYSIGIIIYYILQTFILSFLLYKFWYKSIKKYHSTS